MLLRALGQGATDASVFAWQLLGVRLRLSRAFRKNQIKYISEEAQSITGAYRPDSERSHRT